MVYGASVQIYLLEKSRIISQATGERNYHVFYYLLNGSSDEEKKQLSLLQAQDYTYLSRDGPFCVESIDDKYEFNRLKQSMESVGFSQDCIKKTFSMLSAILLLGNLQYTKKTGYHSDDTASMTNAEQISTLARLLHLSEDKISSALTTRRTITKNETVVTRYTILE
uniref:Myosin motor domain-containing protein n=1 Tax=Romanomermis culicivorax TaxID=13658 RepID=A0A915IMK4_ROMCU